MSGLRIESLPGRVFRAVLFDVDGTLYDAKPMRRAMMRSLLAALLRRPFAMRRRLRALSAYRKALEALRCEAPCDLRAEQLRRAAEASALEEDELAQVVDEWMGQRPLRFLPRSRRPGLLPFLAELENWAVPCGAFSDYPVRHKLEALAVAEFFAVQLDANDERIRSLKPQPKGLVVGAAELGVPIGELLYIGDRAEVDAAAAKAAGAGCVLIGRGEGEPRFADFGALLAELLPE
ncbi:MAG: hypothetical protein CSA62_05640 [Planctomycetota bacterium]|nr:MAG: hypothetical protein CSA62_05640 [Planctomycetota bacterium]